MAISIGDLKFRLSGGGANTSPAASLGGIMTAAATVKSQQATGVSTVTGVTILDAMGNAEGVGTLRWDYATGILSWRPFGGVSYNGIVVPWSGTYTIGTQSGYLVVSVVAASLATELRTDAITVSNMPEQVFDNISATESLNGDVEYRCLYVENTHGADTAFDVRLWIRAQPVGADILHLALDPNGLNANARGPITDEQDSTGMLADITWTQPSSYATALVLGNMAPGDRRAFWIRRTVPEDTITAVANDYSSIAIAALI